MKPIHAKDVPPRAKPSAYPEPYRSMMNGRIKSQLGEYFGLKNFGVNLTRIQPGGQSSLFHRHTKQDEFIIVLEGVATLVTDSGEFEVGPGMCCGFPSGGTAHQLVNRSAADVLYLEVGDRTPGDEATYPRDDIQARMAPEGHWIFTKKDGSSF